MEYIHLQRVSPPSFIMVLQVQGLLITLEDPLLSGVRQELQGKVLSQLYICKENQKMVFLLEICFENISNEHI